MRGSRRKLILLLLPVVVLVVVAVWYLSRTNIPVMEPAGQIGAKERNLIWMGVGLSVLVVIPVYVMTIAIALKYNERNHRTKKIQYSPDWDRSRLFEGLWWGIPIVIIGILSVITWCSSHSLDPYRPLDATVRPVTLEVVALDWKWLFIYPQQNVASVNMLEVPENTPINFDITSDTVMNSFWIPQLGSQIYAMPGMSTQLHLEANKLGTFAGSSANISGVGFAHMTFTTKSVSAADFNKWLAHAHASQHSLDTASYNQLAQPTIGHAVTYYSSVQPGLYNELVVKYMTPAQQGQVQLQ
jgi:cytochrome o ubiquinol oxidase subunit II